MINVMVTGSDGQLGQTIAALSSDYRDLNLTFLNRAQLDLTDADQIERAFSGKSYDYCINCAAYTDVEGAEKNPERAYAVNSDGVRNLALSCEIHQVILIHISTDYVFDGEKGDPYTVDDIPNPLNEYGRSKLQGERNIQSLLKSYFIIRTSWLYSRTYGHNFYRTIQRKIKEGDPIFVTDRERGCPTSADNLGIYILDLICSRSDDFGIHHYTDGKEMPWFEFACAIKQECSPLAGVRIEKTTSYPSIAKRPRNSCLA